MGGERGQAKVYFCRGTVVQCLMRPLFVIEPELATDTFRGIELESPCIPKYLDSGHSCSALRTLKDMLREVR